MSANLFLENPQALEEFASAWRDGTLPRPQWTHAAHIAMAAYHGFRLPHGQLFAEMKIAIQRYNEAVGVVSGPDNGYHETLTRFWSEQVESCIAEAAPASRFAAVQHAVARFGHLRDLTAKYYSFDVVKDRRARREWVPPDLPVSS